jgi:hypothetical protein
MRCIFTKSFFRLSQGDQAKVLSGLLADINNQCYVSKEAEAKAKRLTKRIEKVAVEYGVWAEDD